MHHRCSLHCRRHYNPLFFVVVSIPSGFVGSARGSTRRTALRERVAECAPFYSGSIDFVRASEFDGPVPLSLASAGARVPSVIAERDGWIWRDRERPSSFFSIDVRKCLGIIRSSRSMRRVRETAWKKHVNTSTSSG